VIYFGGIDGDELGLSSSSTLRSARGRSSRRRFSAVVPGWMGGELGSRPVTRKLDA